MAAALMGLSGACARQGVPPGGPEDRRPPVVISTTPEPLQIVGEGFEGRVRFRFDERISERVQGGTLDGAIVVSPATGAVRVEHERRALVVSVAGGFQPGLVYRVTLLPVVSDLFNNRMRDPFELVFSTGPEPIATTVAGVAWDRVSGRGAPDYLVTAVRSDVTTGATYPEVHLARTDTGGVYAFRYIPEGRYTLTAFEDRNRNREVDPMEPQGAFRVLMGAGDTIFAGDIAVLQPDTTPARVTSVTPLDSLRLLIELDDYLDPDVPLTPVGVSLLRESDSTTFSAARVQHEHEYIAFAESVADSLAVLDSLDAILEQARREEAADSAVAPADSAAAVGDSGAVADTSAAATAPVEPARRAAPRRVPPPGLNGRPVQRPSPPRPGETQRPPGGPNGERLPSRQIVVTLPEPLVPNAGYRVTVTGVRNLYSIPLGGGQAAVVLEPPPQPGDSAGIPDSAAVDTGAVMDTAAVIDTASVIDTLWLPAPGR